MSNVHSITSKNQLFEQVKSNSIVIVDFYAEWCGPCVRIAPEFAKMAAAYPEYVFMKCNVDHHHAIAQQYGVTAMPTFIIFKDGQQYKKVIGADLDAVKEAIEPEKPFQFAPFKSHIKRITSAEDQIFKHHGLVFVKFTAEWCGPCKLIHPTFIKLAESYPKHIFAECDIDELPNIANQHTIKTIPTIVVFRNGEHCDTWRELDSSKLQALAEKECRKYEEN